MRNLFIIAVLLISGSIFAQDANTNPTGLFTVLGIDCPVSTFKTITVKNDGETTITTDTSIFDNYIDKFLKK